MTPERQLRRDAVAIFREALAAADPRKAIQRHLRLDGQTLLAGRFRYDLKRYRRVLVVGAGKASATMAAAVERILGPRIAQGLVCTKYGHRSSLRRIGIVESGHPVPDENGVEGARRMRALLETAGEKDLVIALISGGASALLPSPADGISLVEKQQTTKLLLDCGATIHEINAVRKHLSAMKGGQMARLAAPAPVLALLLSDVIGDPLDVIGSGPAAPDESTFQTAWGVVERYGLERRIPAKVRRRFEDGLRGAIPDTPKPGDPCFAQVRNLIIGSNRLAVDAAAGKARALGYRPVVLSTSIEGETRDIALMHAEIARECRASGRPAKPPVCLISGGETTVTIRGQGKGGRNMEFVLAGAERIAGLPATVLFSAGTDGTDGPTDAAGALADGFTCARAEARGLNPRVSLATNDSYPFFAALNDLVITKPTGTNVMDIRLVLVG
jgi:hydroxypyruvate reductase